MNSLVEILSWIICERTNFCFTEMVINVKSVTVTLFTWNEVIVQCPQSATLRAVSWCREIVAPREDFAIIRHQRGNISLCVPTLVCDEMRRRNYTLAG